MLLGTIERFYFYKDKQKYLKYPVIIYTTITYILGTLAALIVRFII